MHQQDVIGQMLAAGLDVPPQPLVLSGRRVYFGPKKKQWYRLREVRSNAGAYVVVGDFGDFKHSLRERVQVDWKGMAAEERERVLALRRQAEAQAREERVQEAQRAAMTAGELWREGSGSGRSEYLERKGVNPGEACRFMPDGSILVPLLRYDLPREQALRAVQRIWPDGTKRFTRGFEKPGCALRLGLVEVGEPLLVCEGYATGLSLRLAVERRLPVFVGLDAGNLLPVVQLLRGLYPSSRILICADDDWRTTGNPGRDSAFKAARAVPGVTVTYPIFRPGLRGPKDTDFNDLHRLEGVAMVARQLSMVLPMLKDARRAA